MTATNGAAHSREPWLGVPSNVGETLRAGIPRARERVIRAIRSEVAAYDQPLKGEFEQVVRESVDGALNRFIEMIELHDVDALGPRRPHFYELGQRAFREGGTLNAQLRAYQLGGQVALREVVNACGEAGVEPDVVYQLAETVMAYVSELSAASMEGYGAESAAAANVTQEARQELVELLVLHPPNDLGRLSGAVQRARYARPEQVAALVCAEGDPAELAARIGPDVIGARLGDLLCVLVPDANDTDDALAMALNGIDAAVGTAGPPQHLPQSWEWACRMLELIRTGAIRQQGVVRVEHHLATIFLRGDQPLGSELAARWLAPLEQLTERSRKDLSETLLAWLAHDRNYASAADQLNVHSHTVRYRLRKLDDLYGNVLDDPDARFELQLALRATGLRLRPSSPGMLPPQNGSRTRE